MIEERDIEYVELEPLTPGEASALSYFVAYAAVNHAMHATSLQQITPHEESMIQKVVALDPEAYEMWSTAIMRKIDGGDSCVGVPEPAA